MCFHCLPLGSIDFPLGSALILSYLILSYLFLVFCFPARFWCWDICDGFKYPRGYPHVQQRFKCSLSIPASNGFYSFRTPLRGVRVPGGGDVVLGSDWASATSTTLCNGNSGILDPSQSAIASLPEGHHWSPYEGETAFHLDMVAQ